MQRRFEPGPRLGAVEILQCPHCAGGLAISDRSLRCPTGHSFDIARQGYVNLLPGDARPGTADTADMATARREFLESGWYGPIAERLADSAAGAGPVVDAGGGTGYYLNAVLDRSPQNIGLALDVSKHAARIAARAHPRAMAAVVDLWRPLPVRTGSVGILLNVFAPRNGPEFRRILRPDGKLVVVTPTERHLAELAPLGMLSVDQRKDERLRDTLGGDFRLAETASCTATLSLSHQAIEQAAAMSPSAHHIPVELLPERVRELAEPFDVTMAVTVRTFRPI
jgi:23S rRNA (guanine745-N1)-methyltransferase